MKFLLRLSLLMVACCSAAFAQTVPAPPTPPTALALVSNGVTQALVWTPGKGSGCNIYVGASATAVTALKANNTPSFGGNVCLQSLTTFTMPANAGNFAAMDEWQCSTAPGNCSVSALGSIVQATGATPPPIVIAPTYTVQWNCAAGSLTPKITQIPIPGGIAFQIVGTCLPPQ
jgi:hypothetical protein